MEGINNVICPTKGEEDRFEVGTLFGTLLVGKSQEKMGQNGGVRAHSGQISHFHAGDRGSNPLGDATFIPAARVRISQVDG